MEPLQKIAAPYGARALPLRLDVIDAAMRRNVLAQATEKFGHIDVLANIAGAGFTEALHNEVKPLGIRVTLVEPGAFHTDFAGSAITKASNTIADYAALDAGLETYFHDQNGKQMGGPEKAVAVMIDMVNSETAPVRLMLGEDAYQMWDQTLEARYRDLQTWHQRGIDTAYPDAEMNPITL